MLSVAPSRLSSSDAPIVHEIAVVIPLYMGRSCLQELCRRLIDTLETITRDFVVVLVDDGSPDEVWPLVQELCRQEPRIRGIRLSRNFGQHYAITAGIDYTRARWYVVMDCDLGDAPEDIRLLYAKAIEGCDVVVAARRREGQSAIKRLGSRVFYTAFNLLSGFELDWKVSNFRIFSDRVADGLRQMRERMRFLPANLNFMGFEVSTITLPHHSRAAGSSSYTLRKLIRLAADTILAHSQMPLRITAVFGLIVAVLAILVGVVLTVRTLVWGTTVTGWTSLIVAIFIMGGIQIFSIGIVGIYVGKSFDEAKKRPLYFVRDTVNL